jgi:hypothetical protein
LTILEPLRPSPASNVMSAFRQVSSVQVLRLRHQLDAWSCGYFALWYQLELELAGTERAAHMSIPPADWHEVVWALLRISSLQERHSTENALTLNLGPLWKKVTSTSPLCLGEMLSTLVSCERFYSEIQGNKSKIHKKNNGKIKYKIKIK